MARSVPGAGAEGVVGVRWRVPRVAGAAERDEGRVRWVKVAGKEGVGWVVGAEWK